MTRGLVLGKFLPYHAGHRHLIRHARSRVDELTVLVCSIEREPIPGGVRYQWVRTAHPDCRVVWVNEEVPQAPDESPDFWPIWTDLVRRYAGEADVVFTSEDYGDELARRIGARPESVDPARSVVPISGTQLRANPMKYWDYLPRETHAWFARRVAILGAESTGKTTIAESLAREFHTEWVPEYGRPYCEVRPTLTLLLPDYEAIIWGQATWEDEAAARANRILLCDTDLLTTCTWSDLMLGARPAWITAAARARHYDLTILLEPDVPWVDDGLRVLETQRVEHTRLLRDELEAAGREYVVVGGDFPERLRKARQLIIDRVLGGDESLLRPPS